MRALVCPEPGALRIEDRSDPGEPSPGWVRLRITHVGICGTDYHIWEGTQPFLSYPRVMGHEIAAQVERGGAGTNIPQGTQVVVNPYLSCGECVACRAGKPNCCVKIAVLGVHRDGAMCDHILLPESNLYPAPDLPAESAAAAEFLAIGAHAVRRSGRMSGRALVIGAGPIGLATAFFARIAGLEVWLMDLAGDRRDFAASLGFGVIRAGEEVADATGGDGFDAVFDATGHAGSMSTAWTHAAHGGVLVYVGLVRDTLALPHPEIHKRELAIMTSRNALRADFDDVIDALQRGLVPMDRIVTHRLTLDQAVEDLPRLAQSRSGLVKAVIAL